MTLSCEIQYPLTLGGFWSGDPKLTKGLSRVLGTASEDLPCSSMARLAHPLVWVVEEVEAGPESGFCLLLAISAAPQTWVSSLFLFRGSCFRHKLWHFNLQEDFKRVLFDQVLSLRNLLYTPGILMLEGERQSSPDSWSYGWHVNK